MKKMNKKGFTLVEIMIVVAIIGLLAAIGIPSFTRARASSIEKSKTNNVRIAEGAAEEYAMDNALTDGASIGSGVLEAYIKGGSSSLTVGTATITLPTTVGGNASY